MQINARLFPSLSFVQKELKPSEYIVHYFEVRPCQKAIKEMVSATEIYCTLSFGVHLWKPEKKILHPLHSIKRLFLKRI